MRRIGFIALLALVVGAHPPSPMTLPIERIPNKNFANAFPRWASYTNLTQISSVSVDSREVAHIVAESSPWEISYRNNRIDLRQSNGFSDPVPVATADPAMGETVENPDIWVHDDDTLHVVWEFSEPNTDPLFPPWRQIRYRKKDAAGWGPTIVLATPIALGPTLGPGWSNAPNVAYYKPQIVLDDAGRVHVAAIQVTTPMDIMGLPQPQESQPVHIARAGGVLTLTEVPVMSTLLIGRVRLAVGMLGASNFVSLAWDQQLVAPMGGLPYWEVFESAGVYAVGVPVPFPLNGGLAGPGDENRSPDVAIDSTGTRHVVWGRQNQNQIFHMGSTVPESQVSQNIPPFSASSGALVLIDSRDQIHVLYAGLSYSAKVRNPDPDILAGWYRQERVEAPRADEYPMWPVLEAAMSRADQMHAVNETFYTRTMEYGMGARDEAAMVGLFGAGTANVTNGNLFLTLPLFKTSGVGPSQALSLNYNSLDPRSGLFGVGWRLNYEMLLEDHQLSNVQGSATVFLADGYPVSHFRAPEDNLPWQDDDEHGLSAELQKIGMEYRLKSSQGELLVFDGDGRLRTILDTTGNFLQLVWDGTGRLVQIVDMLGNGGTGRITSLEYEVTTDALHGPRVSRIIDPMGREYRFEYTGNGLSRVIFWSHVDPATGLKPTYGMEYYLGTPGREGLLSRLLPPRGLAADYGWTFTYQADRRVVRVDDPAESYLLDAEVDGPAPPRVASVHLTYDEALPVAATRQTAVVNRRNKQTTYLVEPRRNLVWRIVDPTSGLPGNFPVDRIFDGSGNLAEVHDKWGFVTRYTYHPINFGYRYVRNNLKTVERTKPDGSDLELIAEYLYTPDSFNRPLQIKTWATPPGGTTPVKRTTEFFYNEFAQQTRVKHPDVTRPDGAKQLDVITEYQYNGPRKALSRVINEELRSTHYSAFHLLHGLPQNVLREGGSQPEETQYDDLGNVVGTKRPQGGIDNDLPNWTVTAHDELYRVRQVIDPLGKVTTTTYDLDSNVVLVQPAAGGATSTSFDRRGFVTGGSGPDGSWSQLVDANGNVRKRTSLRGYPTFSTYDNVDRAILVRAPGATTVPEGGGGPAMETQFVHDGYDPVTKEHFTLETRMDSPGTSHRGTKTVFDNRGRKRRVLAADDQRTKTENFYDEQDQLVATELWHQPAGAYVFQSCTVSFRDARDRVHRVRVQGAPYAGGAEPPANLQASTWTIFNKVGSVVQTVDPLGSPGAAGSAHKTTNVLDARERVQFVIDGKGNTVLENVWGDDDLLVERLVPDPETKSATSRVRAEKRVYTARKELKRSLNFDGVGLFYTYGDLSGQVRTVTNALDRVTETSYHPDTQRVDEVRVALGTPGEARTKSLWQNGLLSETRAFWTGTEYRSIFRYFYDEADRLERFEAPLVAPERTSYTAFSDVAGEILGTKAIAHAHNKLSQRVSSSWTGSHTQLETRTYNGAGMAESVRNDTHEKVLTYDVWLGTPNFETFKLRNSVTQVYEVWRSQTHKSDVAKNYVKLTDPEGGVHEWVHDENNRVKEIRFGSLVENNPLVCTIDYTPGGLVDRVTLHNAAGAPIAVTTHTYDRLGRKVGQKTEKSGTLEVLADFRWEHNPLDLVTRVTPAHLGAGVQSVLGYNERNELASEVTTLPGGGTRSAIYVTDAAGNRTSQTIGADATTFQYNDASQLTDESWPDRTLTHLYDEWGNETTRTTLQGPSTITETYGFNHLNLMSSYVRVLGPETQASWTYLYHSTAERYAKLKSVGDGSSEYYVPAGGNVVIDYSDVNTPKNRYVQGTGVDSKYVRIALAPIGERRHYLGDLVGTVGLTLTDAAAAAESSLKDAWGVSLWQSVPALSERYGFAQREHDSESGLVHMRARNYDPRLGRFTQADPLRQNRALDQYLYSSNNPVTLTDPMGTDWRDRLRVVGAFVGSLMADAGSLVRYSVTRAPMTPWGLYNQTTDGINVVTSQASRLGKVYGLHREVGHSVPAAVGLTVSQGLADNTGGTAFYEGWSGIDTNRMLETGNVRPTLDWGQKGGRFGVSLAQAGGTAMLYGQARQFAIRDGDLNGHVPQQLTQGQAHELRKLTALGLEKNSGIWRPGPGDIESAAFNVIVGKPRFTPIGEPVGTILDSANTGFLREIKGGSSTLDSSYQLRLQTYYSLKTGQPYIIDTTRPVNPAFGDWLRRWGVTVENTSGTKPK